MIYKRINIYFSKMRIIASMHHRNTYKRKKLRTASAALAGVMLFCSVVFTPVISLAENSKDDGQDVFASESPSPSESTAPSPTQSMLPSVSPSPSPSASVSPSSSPVPSESGEPSASHEPTQSASPSPSASEELPEYAFSEAPMMLMTAAAAQEESVTVRIKLSIGSVSAYSITVKGQYLLNENKVTLPNGTYTLTAGSSGISISGHGVNYSGSSVTLLRAGNQAKSDAGITQKRSNGNSYYYLGSMIYTAQSGNITAINYVDIEDYLYGVVGYEMSNSWPLEALKAQAVCARGYAKRELSPSGSYDMTDTASDQVYYGYDASYGNVIKAVDSTKGQIMTYNGSTVYAYYSASNGGQTELPGNAWGGGSSKNAQYPYLVQKDDKYDLENAASSVQVVNIPADPSSLVSQKMVEIVGCSTSCNVREQPSTASGVKVIGQAPLGAKYIMLGKTGDWYQILYTKADGSTVNAYVNYGFIKELTPASGLFVYSNAAVSDIQNKAYAYCRNTLKFSPYNNAATSIRIDRINSVSNGTERWPGTGSRCYVTAVVNVTVSCASDASGSFIGTNTFNVSITLMNSGSSGYINDHDYLSSSLRMRGIEKASDGWNIVCRRYGHGVGMSQRGAQTMASKYSLKYTDILSFYFPGTVITGSSAVETPDYGMSGGMVTGVAESTDVQTFLSGVQSIKTGASSLTLKNTAGAEKTSGIVCTGDVLTVAYSYGTESEVFNIVIYGDVNSDGSIGLADLLAVQKNILGAKELTGAMLTAADVSRDSGVDILDLLKIQKHLLGSSLITQ